MNLVQNNKVAKNKVFGKNKEFGKKTRSVAKTRSLLKNKECGKKMSLPKNKDSAIVVLVFSINYVKDNECGKNKECDIKQGVWQKQGVRHKTRSVVKTRSVARNKDFFISKLILYIRILSLKIIEPSYWNDFRFTAFNNIGLVPLIYSTLITVEIFKSLVYNLFVSKFLEHI